MKERVKKQHNNVHAKEVDKRSIETAVEYLIEECLKLNDIKGATILNHALKDFKNNQNFLYFNKREEQIAVKILREVLNLTEIERNALVEALEIFDDCGKKITQ